MAYITIYDATATDRQQLEAYLGQTDHHREYVTESIAPDTLHADSEVISVFVTSNVTRQIIEALPKLRLIACRSTGYNNIDLQAAGERGIAVVNVPSYGDHTVAEYTFALLLSLSRRLQPTAGVFDTMRFDQSALTGFDLSGRTLGLIGMGRIGRRVARIAAGFDMRIVAYDPYPDEAAAVELGYSYVSLDELAAQSDVISLHSPYTKENHRLINQAFLAKAKPGVILVNTARGELVDTVALIDALQTGRVGGAALDVLEGERVLRFDEALQLLRRPSVSAADLEHSLQFDVLRRMPNVIITPHNAFNTIEAIDRINRTSADNMVRFWQGETPNRVNPQPA